MAHSVAIIDIGGSSGKGGGAHRRLVGHASPITGGWSVCLLVPMTDGQTNSIFSFLIE